MRRLCSRVSSLFCILACAMGISVDIFSTEVQDNLDRLVETAMRCHHVPGLTLAVTSRDKVLLQKGYGRSGNGADGVTPHTLFPIASTTKAFTVTLLAIILQHKPNNYTWDTPLRTIFGRDFEMYDRILTEQTTLLDVLAHRTGIPDYFLPLMAVLPETETRQKLVWRTRFHKPKYGFRSTFKYNNFLYMLGGHAAEVIQGNRKWNDLVRAHIFEPLQMTSSTFSDELSSDEWEALAAPFILRNGELIMVNKQLIRQTNGVGPAGSIVSNGEDMGKWLQFHLRRGLTASGSPLVDRETLEETYQERMMSPPARYQANLLRDVYPISDVHVGYDMGWMTNIYRGYRRVWHSGSIATFKTQVWLYPDVGYGMYISCNGPPISSTTRALKSILQYISDILLRETPWINSTTVCTMPAPWEPTEEPEATSQPSDVTDDQTPRPISAYTGKYYNPGFGDITVLSVDGARLELHMGQIFDADLYYDAKTDKFLTNLTGKYWYSDERIPIHFSNYLEESGYDSLHIPLYTPFDKAETMPFFRGHQQDKYNSLRGDMGGYCPVNCFMKNQVDLTVAICLIAVLYLF